MNYKILHKATEEQINTLTANGDWHVHTFTVDSRDGEIVVLLESGVIAAIETVSEQTLLTTMQVMEARKQADAMINGAQPKPPTRGKK